MAITELGVIIVGVRGTIGGITFSANKSGTYAKSLVTPSNPGTPNQLVQRGIIATMGSKWRALSAAQQAAWDAFAAAPASAPTTAPATFGLTLNAATGAAGDANFQYTNGDFAGIYAILEISVAAGQGSNVQTSRYLMQHEAVVVGAANTDFGVRYYATYGVTQVGQRFFGRLYRQATTGIRSTPLALYTDVV